MRVLKDSWLDTYVARLSKDSEAPEEFHFWSGATVLAAALKRSCWVQRNFKLYPNLYVILTGPPGTGKGAAINPALELAKASGVVNMLTDRLTVPFVIERLAKGFAAPVNVPGGGGTFVVDNSALIATTEMPVLLDNPKDLKYWSDLWDSRESGYQYGTRGGGHLEIAKPNTHILAGVTPSGIAECLPQQSISSGFTSRINFVYAEGRKDVPWPNKPPPDTELIEDLRYIGVTVKGSFTFEDKAKPLFESIYRASKPEVDDEEFLASFKSRRWVHIAKLAQLIVAARTDDMVITEADLTEAQKRVEKVEANLGIVFGRVGAGDLVTAADKVLTFIENKGFASRQAIAKALWRYFPRGSYEDLTTILATFIEAGLIIEDPQSQGPPLYKMVAKIKSKP